MLKAGYKYTETEFLKSVKTGDGNYLIFSNGIWYELASDGCCKYLSKADAGRMIKSGIVEMPFEITMEDVSNAEKWLLED